jgi:glycosyltransferase involved in cell wall biosynthesis
MSASNLPWVSITTPCFNAASFVRQTIESVLAQDYPNLEYLVVDGGSSDGSLDIIKSFSGRLRYWSESDSGPAEAINKGFERSRGEIFAWISADDLYEPGAVTRAVRALADDPGNVGVYGDAGWIDSRGTLIAPYPTKTFNPDLLRSECFICQPACFIRSEAFRRAGMLNPNLQCAFDYDLWIRLAQLGRLQHLPEQLASSRMHESNRTLSSKMRVFHESMAVLRSHYRYVPIQWIHSYCCFLLDGRDQFFEPALPSGVAFALSLPVGCWYNPRQPVRYAREWASSIRRESFTRLWDRVRLKLATRGGPST